MVHVMHEVNGTSTGWGVKAFLIGVAQLKCRPTYPCIRNVSCSGTNVFTNPVYLDSKGLTRCLCSAVVAH